MRESLIPSDGIVAFMVDMWIGLLVVPVFLLTPVWLPFYLTYRWLRRGYYSQGRDSLSFQEHEV